MLPNTSLRVKCYQSESAEGLAREKAKIKEDRKDQINIHFCRIGTGLHIAEGGS